MEPNSRTPGIVGTLGICLLVLLPLLGLLNAIVDRPADPFSGDIPTLGQLIQGARVWQLLLHSVLLAIVVALGSVVVDDRTLIHCDESAYAGMVECTRKFDALSGHEFNERADMLANKGLDDMLDES